MEETVLLDLLLLENHIKMSSRMFNDYRKQERSIK